MKQPGNGDTESRKSRLTLKELLASLGDLSLQQLDPSLELVELSQGQNLFEQGDEADSMYVLVAGVLGVRVRHEDGTEAVIDKLAPGAVVGEMALLSGQPRTATVYAEAPAGLLRLDRAQFEALADGDEAGAQQITDKVAPRWQRLQLSAVLRGLFGDLDVLTLHELQDRLSWQHLSNGDILFRQGDSSDGMYIVINGRLSIGVETPEGDSRQVGDVEPGQTVGEFALLTDELRTATVYATRETNVVKLTADVFEQLVGRHPELMSRITRIIVERRQRALKSIPRSRAAALGVAVLPISANLDVRTFVDELAERLSAFGRTLALDASRFEARYGLEGAADVDERDPQGPALVAWLGELEAGHDYIVYAAETTPSNWTRRCLSQADRVLLLADPDAGPVRGPLDDLLAAQQVPVRTELVLWHPAHTSRPDQTAAWLKERPEQRHHHLRQADRSSMDRLARWLSGHTIGLVLSGGGARGLAHIGVHRAFDELGVPVDFYAGTSIGALIAGVFALGGLAPGELDARARVLSDPRRIFDRTLPLTALNSSRRVTGLLQELFGEQRIEDLWQPYFCISTNLSRAEPVLHQSGPLWRAVRSSLAIPGVFTPVMEDDEVLVDGGIMDNFPVDTMTSLTASDRVVGVHVSPHMDAKRPYDMDTHVSGWRVFFSRLNPFSKRLRTPSLVGIILRTLEVNSAYREKREQDLASLVIHPEVKRFGFGDYDAYEDIAEAGYQAAIGPLADWKAQQVGL